MKTKDMYSAYSMPARKFNELQIEARNKFISGCDFLPTDREIENYFPLCSVNYGYVHIVPGTNRGQFSWTKKR